MKIIDWRAFSVLCLVFSHAQSVDALLLLLYEKAGFFSHSQRIHPTTFRERRNLRVADTINTKL
jgi:hypothetical protein